MNEPYPHPGAHPDLTAEPHPQPYLTAQPYPSSYPQPTPPRPKWQHPGLIITLLVLFPPAGILLAWLSDWPRGKKIAATAISGLWFLVALLSDPPQEGGATATARPGASASATERAAPAAKAAPLCNAPGRAPAAPDPSGPLDHVRLGKLTCEFETNGKLDDAEVPVTITNKGARKADYTVTVQLLDASGSVIKSNDLTKAYGLAPGGTKTASAILVGWGEEIETDGAGYWTRVSVVERKEQRAAEPAPTEDGDFDLGDHLPKRTITPGAYCSKAGAVGVSKTGKVYTCRHGRWRS
ncbi:hypothetical protein [Streptomyces sp. NPDC059909]|uniref:hypothetical protein n=1 Tax=Streptomyces sp. NPDC059909 TaxID=3346998 RepID=UPI0036664259